MKIKKGDKVQFLSGKDRGKTGKVLTVLPTEGKVVVEGLNIRFKHRKGTKAGEKGQRIEFSAAIAGSRVMLVCPKCGKTTRVGYQVNADGSKLRKCKHCSDTF